MNVNMWNHAATQKIWRCFARVACMSCNGRRLSRLWNDWPGGLRGQEAIIAAVRDALKLKRDLEAEGGCCDRGTYL